MLINMVRGCVYSQIEPMDTPMVYGDEPSLGRGCHVVYPPSHGWMGNVWIVDVFHKVCVFVIHLGIILVEKLQRHIHDGIIQIVVGS